MIRNVADVEICLPYSFVVTKYSLRGTSIALKTWPISASFPSSMWIRKVPRGLNIGVAHKEGRNPS